MGKFSNLLEMDEFTMEMTQHGVLQDFHEPKIQFTPTTPTEIENGHSQSLNICDPPCYTDRIFYCGKEVEVLDYFNIKSFTNLPNKPVVFNCKLQLALLKEWRKRFDSIGSLSPCGSPVHTPPSESFIGRKSPRRTSSMKIETRTFSESHSLKDFVWDETKPLSKDSNEYVAVHSQSKKSYRLFILNQSDYVGTREMHLFLNLDCPFIEKCHKRFLVDNVNYVLVEMVCTTLCDVIGGTKVTNHVARFYCAQILVALRYLHSQQAVYGDLHLEKIHLCSDGYLKLASILSNRCSPEHTSPESWEIGYVKSKHENYWQFGVLCFQLLCGHLPTENDTFRGFHGNLSFPSDVTPQAKSFLTKLLEKDPTKRLGKSGIEQIMKHSWFDKFDWESMQKKESTPPFYPGSKSQERIQEFSFSPHATLVTNSEEGIQSQTRVKLVSKESDHSLIELTDSKKKTSCQLKVSNSQLNFEKNGSMKLDLIKGLYASEKAYVELLEVLLDKFVKPMRMVLRNEIHGQLFKGIDAILETNSTFFQNFSENLVDSVNFDEFLTILLDLSQDFKNYIPYVENHCISLRTLEAEKRFNHVCQELINSKFDELLQQALPPNIEDYLILPIQRIGRYQLFLDELSKCSSIEEQWLINKAIKRLAMVIESCDKHQEKQQDALIRQEVLKIFKLDIKNDHIVAFSKPGECINVLMYGKGPTLKVESVIITNKVIMMKIGSKCTSYKMENIKLAAHGLDKDGIGVHHVEFVGPKIRIKILSQSEPFQTMWKRNFHFLI